MIKDGKYIGTELMLFESATNWKRYLWEKLSIHLKGDILEVGAGIGGSTIALCDGSQNTWVCLEPDRDLAQEIEMRKKQGLIPEVCQVETSYLVDVPLDRKFDAILYLDVIEHIEADSKEIELASQHLKKDGVLIILVPAHQFLYTQFDKNIGHYRRYSKAMLRHAIPLSVQEVKLEYLDSVGLFASLANKLLLKKALPTQRQIQFWDTFLVRLSKLTDRLLFYKVGKSVLGVWRKTN